MNGYLQSALVGALFLAICGAIGTSLLFYAKSDMAPPYHGTITPKAVAPSETEITPKRRRLFITTARA